MLFRPMKMRRKLLFMFVVALAMAGFARAQTPPPPRVLRADFRTRLERIWDIKDIETAGAAAERFVKFYEKFCPDFEVQDDIVALPLHVSIAFKRRVGPLLMTLVHRWNQMRASGTCGAPPASLIVSHYGKLLRPPIKTPRIAQAVTRWRAVSGPSTRVTALAEDPAFTLAGTDQEGLLSSRDHGLSWKLETGADPQRVSDGLTRLERGV